MFNKHDIKLVALGFIQIFFIAANTLFIAKINYPMIAITAFLTNLVFSYSVKMLAFSEWSDRFSYAFGCMFGCITGTFIASLIR